MATNFKSSDKPEDLYDVCGMCWDEGNKHSKMILLDYGLAKKHSRYTEGVPIYACEKHDGNVVKISRSNH